MNINAENLIVGRIATIAAKKALLGESVMIINCEKAVISGNRKFLFVDYLNKRKRGTHRKGPFYYNQPERFVKRIIRGMLPHRQEKGRSALKRIKCFTGVPEAVKVQDFSTVEGANCQKLRSTNYVYVKDICRVIGGK